MQEQERRIFERLEVDFPVKFSYLEGAKEGMGRIINISATGGGVIVTNEQLPIAAVLDMWLHIPDNKEPLRTKGEVVWSIVSAPGVYKAGVKFDKVDFMGISRVLRNRKG
jgi:hypothetical protein